MEENRKRDRAEVLHIFTTYDIVISEKIKDPNVEKMKKIV